MHVFLNAVYSFPWHTQIDIFYGLHHLKGTRFSRQKANETIFQQHLNTFRGVQLSMARQLKTRYQASLAADNLPELPKRAQELLRKNPLLPGQLDRLLDLFSTWALRFSVGVYHMEVSDQLEEVGRVFEAGANAAQGVDDASTGQQGEFREARPAHSLTARFVVTSVGANRPDSRRVAIAVDVAVVFRCQPN